LGFSLKNEDESELPDFCALGDHTPVRRCAHNAVSKPQFVPLEITMIWKPNTSQLETIAIMGHARSPVDKIAAALGITPEEFSAWAGRLALGRAWSALPPMPVAKVVPPLAPLDPKIRAQRLFEGDQVPERMP
jgi:hypothetical protein